jgi:hypothetical protein
MGTAVRQLVRIAHANQVGREAMAEAREVGDDVASEGGGCRVAVEEDDRVALPDLDVRYLAAQDLQSTLVVRNHHRDHDFFFLWCSVVAMWLRSVTPQKVDSRSTSAATASIRKLVGGANA